MPTLLDVVRMVAQAETGLQEHGALLVELYKRQQLTPLDVAVYNRTRCEVYAAQMDCYGSYMMKVGALLRTVGLPDEARRIPMPVLSPAFPLPANDPRFVKNAPPANQAATISGGLANAGLIIAGVFVVSFCAVLLAVAAIVIILGGITILASAGIFIFVYYTRTEQEKTLTFLRTRQDVIRECMAAGRSAEECKILAEGIPEPDPTPPPFGAEWPKYLAISAGALGLGLLFLAFPRFGGGYGGGGGSNRTIVVRGD